MQRTLSTIGINTIGINNVGKNIIRKRLKPIGLIALVATLSGCASWGVQPWDRDLLAKPQMAINASPLDQAIDDHIYFSKEASSGGRSFAGGGCGCN